MFQRWCCVRYIYSLNIVRTTIVYMTMHSVMLDYLTNGSS